jgi:hypothetical protein
VRVHTSLPVLLLLLLADAVWVVVLQCECKR